MIQLIRNVLILILLTIVGACGDSDMDCLRHGFQHPPMQVRPGVYWYFMDGNMSKEGMTKDLESMKAVGIGAVIFLEVNVGVPRGSVDFMTEEWVDHFMHMVREAERLDIEITLGIGPGWAGSGGPWVSGARSMQHLVASSVEVEGGQQISIGLPLPGPRTPYFGEYAFGGIPHVREQWESFFQDVAVLAYPSPGSAYLIPDIDEKALYYREPYTSVPGIRPWFEATANYKQLPRESIVSIEDLIDLTGYMDADGVLNWDAPSGLWTVMRFVSRNNGAVTRPAPLPGLGFEADKFDTTAINHHLEQFIGFLMERTGIPDKDRFGGLKMLHIDSWEMGAQNWTPQFREEFMRRRGYDPLPFYPVYQGVVVESLEKSERFLWDLRITGQELVLENHALQVRNYAHRHNMGLSMQHYDMNPTADMELGGMADVPSCEFWSRDFGFNSAWSCIQAASIAHVGGKQVLAAEAFTAHLDAWRLYPGSMKNQGDWAFASGVNRFFFHTYQHQPLPDHLRPGMTMGPYGIHHNRGQTWWDMSDAYHLYVSRCQYLLQQGRPVADILYLTAEGTPHVFRAPASAMTTYEKFEEPLAKTANEDMFYEQKQEPWMPDRRGYNFSGCSPSRIMTARVEDGQIVFPCGSAFRVLVLPASKTMTPGMLGKIASLISDGAIVVGTPPHKSPSLEGYPDCDQQVSSLARNIWGGFEIPDTVYERSYGKGRVIWGGQASHIIEGELYPHYDATAQILEKMGVPRDFESTASLRYTHRSTPDWDIYFLANRTGEDVSGVCIFRSNLGTPELWDPNTGEMRLLPEFALESGRTHIPLSFAPYQSFFVVFPAENKQGRSGSGTNFPNRKVLYTLEGGWDVYFDPAWGGPGNVHFEGLTDWTRNDDEGIRYYSGTAVYQKVFDAGEIPAGDNSMRTYLDLGEVKHLARVRMNGLELGVLWTAPWEVDVTNALKNKDNKLEIEVVNLWPNRLIGDEHLPDDGIIYQQYPEWLLEDKPRTSGRHTFTTFRHYNRDSPLIESGLKGPVTIRASG